MPDLTCPLPITDYPNVLLAHGAGGQLMHQLLDTLIVPALGPALTPAGHDAAVLPTPPGQPALTTDSYVVRPLFFPGGDIGRLAVYGTVNDLAMAGAVPLALTLGLIIEEGLPTETLWRVLLSVREAALDAGVRIVTGDTKVVERGHGDGIYINTTGLGRIEHEKIVMPERIAAGDAILVSGDIGRHGMAVMGEREGLAFSTPIESDCAPLWKTVDAMLSAGIDVHCMRDATRGGLCAVLNELAQAAGLRFDVVERDIPVSESVRGACEVLGLDALQVACEGRFVVIVPKKDEARALAILKTENETASVVGRVTDGEHGLVTLETPIGGRRILDMPAGELLPRIC
ncbi:MAG TPA: hydrogenase expression/formation protein HypE [Gammaproteobacteria bacterium]|nr:hydrogenase expression/formation protein HypE [Gammaproteobacteria bacterium]MCH77716.1 hydrogenase expression/formation protein HypE [Gammaproteobacteria bacterium]